VYLYSITSSALALAGVIASSASQKSNTPTPFAKKWTDDESNLRRLIGIDN
jgi:hypothetical protein